MAMLRSQFDELTNEQLQILIEKNIDVIKLASKGLIKAQKKLNDLSEQVKICANDDEKLKTILVQLIKIIGFYDKRHNSNLQFAPVLETILMEKLNKLMPPKPDIANNSKPKVKV